ncbi:SIR2 family protein [Phreatobacter sp. HK31-P]
MFLKAVERNEDFPLGLLIGHLFRSSNKIIDVVTTNYDRLIEYACNDAGLLVTTGFRPGYIQAREGTSQLSYSSAGKAIRLVRISKVHGSLDWFQRKDGTVVASPLFELPGEAVTPLIVTPGFNKYERTHDEPFRSAIQGADRALENADGYMCIGFGFRDSHIEPKMLDRCRQKSVPVTVLGRTLTDEAKSFLSSKAGIKYLGLEATIDGTRAYTHEHPAGVEIKGVDAWSTAGFIKLVT